MEEYGERSHSDTERSSSDGNSFFAISIDRLKQTINCISQILILL